MAERRLDHELRRLAERRQGLQDPALRQQLGRRSAQSHSATSSKPKTNSKAAITVVVACISVGPIALIVLLPLFGDTGYLIRGMLLTWMVIGGVGGSGLYLLQKGWWQRVGDAVHCAACDYQLGPDANQYEHCPECGSDVTRLTATIRGTQQCRPGYLCCGAGLVLAGGFFLVSVANAPKVLLGSMPTGMLSWYAASATGMHKSEAWDELTQRTMTEAQRDRFARRLLDFRNRSMLAPAATNWLEQQVLQEAIDAELVQRYFEEPYQLYIDLPEQVESHEAYILGIRSDMREPRWGNLRPYFVFESMTWNGKPAGGFPRTNTSRVCVGERPDWYPAGCRTGFQFASRNGSLPLGQQEVELVVWLVYLPNQPGGYEIEWDDDGLPMFPPEATWSKRYVLHGSITITESSEASCVEESLPTTG